MAELIGTYIIEGIRNQFLFSLLTPTDKIEVETKEWFPISHSSSNERLDWSPKSPKICAAQQV